MPSDRQVCIHKDWWTKIIWNKDEECYYTNRLLKKLHDYNEVDSKEESQDSNTKEPTVDQQIQQTPIDPILKNSPLVPTMKLPGSTMTTTMEETTTATATMSTFDTTLTQSQRITSAMQQAFQQRKKLGPPGGGSGPPGRGQPPATQQPVPPAPDVKAMGSLLQIFYGDWSKADDFIEEVKGYFHLNADVPGYNSPYKKVAFTLTLVKEKRQPNGCKTWEIGLIHLTP